MRKILFLGYGLDQPSFRHRMRSLVEPLEAADWTVREEQFPSGRYGLRTWERRHVLRWADVVVLHQIKLAAPEARLMAALTQSRVFDFDDAIYVRKPRRLGEPVHDSRWRRQKFAATCRSVDIVAAGNEVLAGAAQSAARSVAVLPTAIEAAAYRPPTLSPAHAPTISWIGSPENLVYLEMIRPALARLAARYPTMRVKVICSAFPDWSEINIERVVWSTHIEAAALAASHVGIMPLTDDEWARGKCAFKLLQYMATALPCVASPVGANAEAVLDGVTGFHARSVDDWERRLEQLMVSADLRSRLGANGRAHVEHRYALRNYQAAYIALLTRLAARRQ